MESEQIQPPPVQEPDFARIAQEAPQPTLAERLGGKALAWGGAMAAIALVALAALWLREERSTNQAMAIMAGSARSETPAAAPAEVAAPAAARSTGLPPLVMLPAAQEGKPVQPAPAPAASPAAPVQAAAALPAAKRKPAVAARPAAAAKAAVRTAPPKLAAKAQRPAAKPARTERRLATSTGRPPAPVTSTNLNIAVAQRCKTGDLARDCLAALCREGNQGAACQALSKLEN